MKSEWKTVRAADFMDFNPRLSIKKGTVATKISMDKLRPFTKAVPSVEQAEFSGGTKFANGDTIMARITPCLENGKTAFVDCLRENEIAFGSTEFIVLRAKPGVSDPQFVYYLATSPEFRNVAIKSMVGSSGRQRVQQPVLENLELTVPKLPEQEKIGRFLAELDDKIALNERVNDNFPKKTNNPNPSPIGNKFGLFLFGPPDASTDELSHLCCAKVFFASGTLPRRRWSPVCVNCNIFVTIQQIKNPPPAFLSDCQRGIFSYAVLMH